LFMCGDMFKEIISQGEALKIVSFMEIVLLLIHPRSGRTIQQRKEYLFDEYEHFRAIGNESIHDYFVRFHKLVNDMKITQLNISTHQMNTKFVNNLPAYWGKYVTNVKQNMDISTTPYVQIYTHLKAYEPHAKKTLDKCLITHIFYL
ncbi:hypothetical protein Tco_0342798, partial [Tanacetum coccineum]